MTDVIDLLTKDKKIIIGWDTEFNADKNELYSHQFFTILKNGVEIKDFWEIADFQKISWKNFLNHIHDLLIKNFNDLKNYDLILIAHYGTAEIGTFSDFKKMLFETEKLEMIEFGKYATYKNLETFELFKSVQILDTMNFEKRSLWEIGKTLGIPKIDFKKEIFDTLPELKKEDFNPIENFGFLLNQKETRSICIGYALRDAEICFKYYLKMIDFYCEWTGKIKIKQTLPAMAEDLLIYENGGKKNFLPQLGYYPVVIKNGVRNKKGQLPTRMELHPDFKHDGDLIFLGGRNQVYFSGVSYLATADFDLTGAYTLFLNLIKNLEIQTDQKGNVLNNQYDVYDLKSFLKLIDQLDLDDAISLQGSFSGKIKLKNCEKISPLLIPTGESLSEVTEWEGSEHILFLTYLYKFKKDLVDWDQLNDDIKLIKIYKTGQNFIFKDFINKNNIERQKWPKGSIENQNFKLLNNSVYGKLTQGLNKIKIKDYITKESKRKPPSQITNPLLAAFVTLGVRLLTFEPGHHIQQNLNNEKIKLLNIITDGCLVTVENYDQALDLINVFNNLPFNKQIAKMNFKKSIWELKHFNPNPNIIIRPRIDFPLINNQTKEYIKGNLNTLKIAWPSAFDKHFDPVGGLELLQQILFKNPKQKIARNRLNGFKKILDCETFLNQEKVTGLINWNIPANRKPTKILNDQNFKGVEMSTFDDLKNVALNRNYLNLEKNLNNFIFYNFKNIQKLIDLRNQKFQTKTIDTLINDLIVYLKNQNINLTYNMLTNSLQKQVPRWSFDRVKKNLTRPKIPLEDLKPIVILIKKKNRLYRYQDKKAI